MSEIPAKPDSEGEKETQLQIPSVKPELEKVLLAPQEGGMNHVTRVDADDENFHVRFRVGNLYNKAKGYPVVDVLLSQLPLLQGRNEDSSQTEKRVARVNFEKPIIVFADDNGYIFAVGDGTHRLQKARGLGLDTLKAHVIPASDMGEFSV